MVREMYAEDPRMELTAGSEGISKCRKFAGRVPNLLHIPMPMLTDSLAQFARYLPFKGIYHSFSRSIFMGEHIPRVLAKAINPLSGSLRIGSI
jgi:hypothetical protein